MGGEIWISRHTLSPQMVIRAQVRSLWNIRIDVFQVSVSDIARRNLDS